MKLISLFFYKKVKLISNDRRKDPRLTTRLKQLQLVLTARLTSQHINNKKCPLNYCLGSSYEAVSSVQYSKI